MIYLLRHGEIEQDEGSCYLGQMDLLLTDKGVEQAKIWKREFQKINFSEIYTSDLSRCLETTKIIAGDGDYITEKGLREIRLGKWEGLSRKAVKEQFPDEWNKRGDDMAYAPPGGESFFDLYNRVIPVFRKITDNIDRDILIVTHAGVIRIILTYVLGMPLENIFRVVQDYAGLNLIKNMGDSMKLIRMNIVM